MICYSFQDIQKMITATIEFRYTYASWTVLYQYMIVVYLLFSTKTISIVR